MNAACKKDVQFMEQSRFMECKNKITAVILSTTDRSSKNNSTKNLKSLILNIKNSCRNIS